MTFKNGQEHNCLWRLKNVKNLLVNDIEKPSRMYLFMTFKKRQACFIFFLNYNLFIFFSCIVSIIPVVWPNNLINMHEYNSKTLTYINI